MLISLIIILSACGNKDTHKVPVADETKVSVEKEMTEVEKPHAQFREGSHYFRLENTTPIVMKKGDKIQVTEMFLYGCPHCYELDPKLQKWLKKYDNIDFQRMPAILGPSWAEMAKFYYVAEKLGILDTLHEKFFAEIHSSGQQYISELAIKHFFMGNGVSEKDYVTAYQDKGVMEKTSQARISSVKYKLRGVPVVIINNKWKIAPYFVKDQEQMLELLDYLVELEAVGGH